MNIPSPHRRDRRVARDVETDSLYLRDAYLREFDARVAHEQFHLAAADARAEELRGEIRDLVRLVQDDEGVVQRAPAHIADRRNLDQALGHQRLDPLHRQPVRQGVVEGAPGLRRVAIEHGVWLRPFRNLVYVMPPYICTADEIAQITSAMTEVARALT